MKKELLIGLICFFCLLIIQIDLSDARRMGGGRSFGNRPSYNKPYTQQTPSKSSQRQTTSKNPYTKKRGVGFGGLLGGMLMGGLLGSMFFGGSYMGPNILDIIIILAVVFIIFRIIKSRKKPALSGTSTSSYNHNSQDIGFTSSWDQLRTKPDHTPSPTVSQNIPDLDEEEFIKGAKSAFIRLQEAWDARELEDIKQFTSPEFFEHIKTQAAQDPNPGQTEILLLNAQIVDSRIEGKTETVSVLFEVLMREEQNEQQPKQVKEIWHFSRMSEESGSNWLLEGIQQLEN